MSLQPLPIIVQQPWLQWFSVFIQQPWNTVHLWDLYGIHTTIIPKWFFLCLTHLLSPTKPSSITIFYNIIQSQQPQTQTSNPNEDPITNEDFIIRFHKEDMDDFGEHGDQNLFHHNNDQSDVEGVAVPISPMLQYHQPRRPMELNLDHLPQYIDHHHFV